MDISWQRLISTKSAHAVETKKLGQYPCVQDTACSICDSFSESQRETLSTSSYRIHKDRKAGLLVSPKEVTVLSSVNKLSSESAPADQSSVHSSEQTAPVLQPSAQVSTQAPASFASTSQDVSYITSDQFSAMMEKMAEQFARFKALLSRGNVFSAPKMSVTPVSAHQIISEKSFINPTARPTGLVRLPADLIDEDRSDIKHVKNKSHKSKSKHKSDRKSHRHSDRYFDKSDTFTPAGESHFTTGTALAGTQDVPGPGIKSVPPDPSVSHAAPAYATSQSSQDTQTTGPSQLHQSCF